MKTIQEIRARFEVLTHSQCWSKHTAANDFTNSYVQWLEDEIIRFDQQNKELREKVKALDDHRIKIEEMELAERNRANKAKAEIQRLTKEVEEYKVVVKNYDKIGSEKTETITSLRELLSRAHEYMRYNARIRHQDVEELEPILTEIENAIKP